MSIRSTIAGLFTRRPRLPANPSIVDWVSHTIRTSDTIVNTLAPSAQAELVKRATQWVMLCSMKNAAVCSQVPVRLYTSKRTRGAKSLTRRQLAKRRPMVAKNRPLDDVSELETHEVLDVLNRPNPYHSGLEAHYFRHLCKEIAGNAYFHTPERGVMLPLWPQWTRIVGSKTQLVAGYTYTSGEVGTELPAAEVTHFKFSPSIFSPLYGMSPLAAVFREADMGVYAAESELSRWKNEGRPPYAVEFQPGTDPQQRKQIAAEIERQIKGVRNAGRGIALALAKITPLGWNNKEMEYVQGQDRLDRVIWAAFDIPESVIRPNEGSLAAAAVGYPGWMRAGIMPRLKRDADDLTWKLLPLYGLDPGTYWFEYDMPSETQEGEESTRLVALTNAGHRTIDEARAEQGYDPLPDGMGAVPRYNGQPMRGVDDDANGDTGSGVAPGVDAGGMDTARQMDDEGTGGDSETAGDGADMEKGLRLVRKTLSLEAQLKKEFESIIDGLTAGLAVDWTIFQAHIVEALAEEYRTGALKALKEVGRADLEATWNVVPTEAIQAINQHGTMLVEQIKGTTFNDLRTRIQEGLAEGKTVADIRNELMSDGYTANRAEVIARTETAWALESGRAVAMKQSGMKSKTWLLAGDPCPMCEGFAEYTAEKMVRLDQSFALAGESWDGTDGKSYTADRDIMHGPLHPNCRCTASYSMENVKP